MQKIIVTKLSFIQMKVQIGRKTVRMDAKSRMDAVKKGNASRKERGSLDQSGNKGFLHCKSIQLHIDCSSDVGNCNNFAVSLLRVVL